MITCKAYAKVNLGLDVCGRRPNGYHDVRLVMQTIDLYDRIEIEETAEKGVVTLSIVPDTLPLPTDDKNLCVKAAKLLLEDAKSEVGLKIKLFKQVPFEAGLGGGSADAAAVLNGVNELLQLGYTKEKLAEIAVKIGADVPYLIYGNTMLAEGIGERLTPISSVLKDVSMVLVKPDFGAATGAIYDEFDVLENPVHPDITAIMTAIEAGDLPGLCGAVGNALEDVTAAHFPVIREIEKEMKKAGALAAMMTGSGPTVFGLFADEESCKKAAAKLQEIYSGYFVRATKFAAIS